MEEKKDTLGSGTVGGARRAMPSGPEPAAATGPLGPNQRWSVMCQKRRKNTIF